MLPTAPRTAREPDVDPERVPRDPPFTAYIANLPFEVDDSDIIRFFQDLKVSNKLLFLLLSYFISIIILLFL